MMIKTTDDRTGRAAGSAVVMVLIFLTIVGAVGFSIFQMTGGMRRLDEGSMLKYFAAELSESAINEVAAGVDLSFVFPRQKYKDFRTFFASISSDDTAALSRICADCSESMPLLDGQNVEVGKIWTGWTFPASQARTVVATQTTALAQEYAGIRSVSPVTVVPLKFRRSHVMGNWLSWGVIQYQCTVSVKGSAFGSLKQTLKVDRMFTISVDVAAAATDPLYPARLIQSRESLKEVISRS